MVSCGERSVFGTLVRKQGPQREQAGRISTLEAYAHLAVALGDEQAVVDQLASYLRTFIAALPHQRAVDETDGLPELVRTPTNPYRRRARSLAHELNLGRWSDAGRAAVGELLEQRQELTGVRLVWRLNAGIAALVIPGSWRGATDAEVGAWPLDLLIEGPQQRDVQDAPCCPTFA